MTQENPLAALLDHIYELEGLVHLALTRDNPPAVLSSLIKRKADEVCALAREAASASEPQDDASLPYVDSDLTLENEVVEQPAQPLEDPQPSAVESSDPVSGYDSLAEVDYDSLASVDDYESHADANMESEVSAYPDEEIPMEEIPMEEIPMEVISVSPGVHDAVSPVSKGRGKPAFSLNDRYRFRRTLFKGSDAEYQGALFVLAGLDSYDEAYAYFIDTLGWNPDDEEVSAFLQLLENWYK